MNNNKHIRRAILIFIKLYGKQDTRVVIKKFSKYYNTTKQRISGNISYMKCKEQTINIINNKPHSEMF